VMNGYEEDVFRGVDPELAQRLREQWRLGDRFVVIYAGTLGMARDCLTFVRAAEELRDLKDVLFAFVGAGERRAEMMDYVESHELDNCLFVPMQPRRDMPAWFALSSVALNSIRKGEALESSLSNKIFDYLGSGVPVVFSGEGDTKEFLIRSGGGLVVAPEDALGMAAAIRTLHDAPELRVQMGARGQAFVISNYSRSKLVAPMERMLSELGRHGPSDPVEVTT
jgi:colanic acid biosynthesis glycosyl transferase WcaI